MRSATGICVTGLVGCRSGLFSIRFGRLSQEEEYWIDSKRGSKYYVASKMCKFYAKLSDTRTKGYIFFCKLPQYFSTQKTFLNIQVHLRLLILELGEKFPHIKESSTIWELLDELLFESLTYRRYYWKIWISHFEFSFLVKVLRPK